MKVVQHIPNFVEGIDPVKTEVASLNALLALPFVDYSKGGADFSRFCVQRGYWANPRTSLEQMHVLLAEYEDGYRWRVIAHLSGEDALEVVRELPEWQPKFREAKA